MEFSNSVGHTSVWQTGVFNPNGHATVCKTGVFFSITVRIRTSKATPRFFLTPVAIPLSVRPVFFFVDNLDWDVNDHTPVSQIGSVVWSLMS